MLERLLIAGAGGQGVVLAGKIIASVGIDQYPHITFFPSYGAEVRGGISNAQVIFSSNEIASPLPEEFDSMIIMNQDSFILYSAIIPKAHTVILNSSLCSYHGKAKNIVAVPATELADKVGDIKTANFIILGAYLARNPLFPVSAVEKTIKEALAGKGDAVMEMNLKAFRTGLKV